MPTNQRSVPARHPLDALVDVMAQLRSENGCPWDLAQTHASLKRYLIEEAYEVLDAIDRQDWSDLCEELGDVLLQVIFHAQIAREAGSFGIDDVIAGITEKMIRRHPHVFSDARAETVDAVLEQWEAIKAREKGGAPTKASQDPSVFTGLSRGLPALLLAEEVHSRAQKAGHGRQDENGLRERVDRALQQLATLRAAGDAEHLAAAWGDFLFEVVRWGRSFGISSELALHQAALRAVERLEKEARP